MSTTLSVKNNKTSDVEVYVTFAADNSANECCPSPVGPSFFPFLDVIDDLHGKFTLAAGATQTFDPAGQCFSGNIGFYLEPQCPVAGADFNNGGQGTSIAEFTLNPNGPCAEAFDISMVNGINCYLKMSVEPGLGWYYGPSLTPVTEIANKGLGLNSGNPGVYPVNCTDCIQLVGPAPCPSLPVGPEQPERICNIQRPGRGGNVAIELLAQEDA